MAASQLKAQFQNPTPAGQGDATRIAFDEVQKVLMGEEWRTPTLLNSWTNYNSSTHENARYYKDALGIVHIQGMIARAGAPAATTVFVLPVQYRPEKIISFPAVDASSAACRIDIDTAGLVVMSSYNSGTFVTFNFVFRAWQ